MRGTIRGAFVLGLMISLKKVGRLCILFDFKICASAKCRDAIYRVSFYVCAKGCVRLMMLLNTLIT